MCVCVCEYEKEREIEGFNIVFLLLICFLRESHIGQGLTGLPW